MTDQEQRKVFSENLKFWLDVRDVKQVDLSRRLGVTEGTVSQWCSGRNMPKVSTVQKITDILHIRKSDLYDIRKDPTETATASEIEAFRAYAFKKYGAIFDMTDKATHEQRKQVENYFRFLLSQNDDTVGK